MAYGPNVRQPQQNLKYYGKPTRRKMCIREVLRENTRLRKYLSTFGELEVLQSIVTVKEKLED